MNSSSHSRTRRGFTLMEIMVAVAILVILMGLLIPAVITMLTKAKQNEALRTMQQLAGANATYAGQNDGLLPLEDAPGPDTWNAAAKPENSQVWYNALPHLLNMKGVGDFATSPRAFYTKANLLFCSGATYPVGDAKLKMPLFAYSFNSKLIRKAGQAVKAPAHMGQITNAPRTVVFLEEGLPGETKAMGQQKKYVGFPKGTAQTFVARYNGRGVLAFIDGHAELVAGAGILTETGTIPFPQVNIVWTKTPEENPNKLK